MFLSLLKIVTVVLYTIIMAIAALIITPFDRKGKAYHGVAKIWSRGILLVCGVKVLTNGIEHLDKTQSYIYISNHNSQFDIPAIIAGIPDQIRLIYKKELSRIPIFGWSLKFNRTYISIDRSRGQEAVQSLENAAIKIRSGTSVLLFAEGTRSPDGKLQQFKRGPFNLAAKAGVPIVPVTINGSYKILPKHSLMIRPGIITLTLASPVEPPPIDGKENEMALKNKVYEIIQKNLMNE
ncbi:MAG: lysophospholipid acyltransferase family protein [Bacteroidota bacterium]|nr:lysophospholipid acyltransferase family protein [Bacteroidota bacterium]